MALSNDLISQFVKATNDNTKPKKETTVYGTIIIDGDKQYIKIDGSNVETPFSSAVAVSHGNRVIATIKNHTVTVTSNLSAPSANNAVCETIVDNKNQNVNDAIKKLQVDTAVIQESLVASEADIDTLKADKVTITEKLSANEADITELQTNKLDVVVADAKYATIKNLDATDAEIHNLKGTYADFVQTTTDGLEAHEASIDDLETKKLDAESAKVIYANIDFSNIGEAAIKRILADSGLIENIIVGDGTVTGKLVGVTISGDLIEGNTIVAEKLVVKGNDGLYYKLNTDGITTEAEQTDYNSLNGSIIKAKSITATKISVDDLVAFDATIGGFNLTDESIYSGAKASVDNTTQGIYLDKEGQMAIGDSSNYIKYYKDQNGSYKLVISANSILLGTSNKSVETAISEVQESVDNIEVGGRNTLLNSANKKINMHGDATSTSEYGIEVSEWATSDAIRIYGTGGTAQIIGILSGTSCHKPGDTDKHYALSIYIKNNHATNKVIISGNHMSTGFISVEPQEIKRVEIVSRGNGWGYPQINFRTVNIGDEFDFIYWHPKLEFGNKVTDWTPAPEDMATAEEANAAQNTANDAATKANNAEALIAQLADSISMLVTDGNGTSLMTQTEDGWTFSTADIQDKVNAVSEGLNDLTSEVGDVNNTVGILQQAVNDLENIAEYVKIGTYEDEPCIELGESDSEFKLRITNTRMVFAEGSTVLAYFNNKSLHIKKAVVEEELQQGGFVWKARSNGNMGLVWKGGTN